jgi:hypothetical protein
MDDDGWMDGVSASSATSHRAAIANRNSPASRPSADLFVGTGQKRLVVVVARTRLAGLYEHASKAGVCAINCC